jgi:hypothetical protein
VRSNVQYEVGEELVALLHHSGGKRVAVGVSRVHHQTNEDAERRNHSDANSKIDDSAGKKQSKRVLQESATHILVWRNVGTERNFWTQLW